MTPNYVLDPLFYDSGWDKRPEQDNMTGFQFVQAQDRSDWVVKLKFKQGGENRFGTGFYLNVPEARTHVILTAGHNLVDAQGKRSQNVTILQQQPRNSLLGFSGGHNNVKVGENDIFCPTSWKTEPSKDYGVILVPRTDESKERGFGFALQLGHTDLEKKDVQVIGYRADTKPGEAVTSSGVCSSCTEDHLGYDMRTESGISGSPVFVAYKGHETVVAIHINDSRRGRKRQSIRLNDNVLEQIFKWVGSVSHSKSLKVSPSRGVPEQGLYLRFLPEQDRHMAYVRVGHEGLDTRFDILPAYAPTPNLKNKPLYIFRLQIPSEWQCPKRQQWVLWDSIGQVVSLTDKVESLCMVSIMRCRMNKPEPFRIVVSTRRDDVEDLVELRMTADDLNEADIAMGFMDTPEVSFGKYLKGKPVKFNDFCLY